MIDIDEYLLGISDYLGCGKSDFFDVESVLYAVGCTTREAVDALAMLLNAKCVVRATRDYSVGHDFYKLTLVGYNRILDLRQEYEFITTIGCGLASDTLTPRLPQFTED